MEPVNGAVISSQTSPRFIYRGMDRAGRLVSGTICASSRQEALAGMEKMALIAIEIDLHDPAHATKGIFHRRVRPEEITQATRDLAGLLQGGVTLDRALLAISQSQDLVSAAGIFKSVHAEVSAGKRLSAALSVHHQAFPIWYVTMIAASEASGRLAETLSLIASERARADALRRRLIAALAYPVFLFMASALVLCFVLSYVVPEFEKAFEGLGTGQRPEMIFAMSRGFRENWSLFAIVATILLGAAMFSHRLPAAQALVRNIVAIAPGTRRAFTYWRAAVLCSNLSALMSGGVEVSSALRIAAGLFSGDQAGVALENAARSVRSGERLSQALRTAGLLPGYAIHMLLVGENTGQVSAALARAASDYEERLDREIATITAIAGPLVLIAVSALIAWIIISVMTALLGMNDLLLGLGGFDGNSAWT